MNATPKIPVPTNEPVLSYAPGAPERIELKRTLKDLSSHQIEIPLVIGGKEVRTGKTADAVMPHCHRHVLAKVHQAGPAEVQAAIRAAREAWLDWSMWEFERRAAVFLKAADLLATRYRPIVNAATMLGQSKTAHQAEIDAACELIDFFRFNPHYAERLYTEQPISAPATWNYLDYRPLEGFVYAITPFNFTSIGGNLPTSPAIMGNTVVWKPAGTAAFSNYFILKLLEDAGLPPGVINFVPGPAVQVSETLLADRGLAGIHFTGSTEVFQALWKLVGERLADYAGYPRLVGETGGKDFILVHASAEVDAVATGIVRGAYEYQGQKCSAASRAYVPDALWPKVRERVLEMLAEVKMGDPADFRNFVGAVMTGRRSTRSRRTSRRHGKRPASRFLPAVVPTTRTATLSSRPSSKPTTRATARCARRFSAPSSRCTSIPQPAGRRRCGSWTRRLPTRSPGPCSRRTDAPWTRRSGRCAMPPGTST